MVEKFTFKDNENWNDKYSYYGLYSLCVTLFLMPFPRGWSLYPLGITLFLGLMAWLTDFRYYIKLFKHKLIILAPLISYFIIHAAGLIFNNNLANVTDKLMFLLVPVFGFPVFVRYCFFRNINLILKGFIFGILFVCLLEFTYALWQGISFDNGSFIFTDDEDHLLSGFLHEQLSLFEHPTYLSIKVLFVVVIIFTMKQELHFSKIFVFITTVLLLAFLYSLSSLTGFILMAILFTVFLYKFLKLKRIHYLLLVILPVIIFTTYKISSVNERLNQKLSASWNRYKNGETDLRNIDPRFLEWLTTINLIQEKPIFGYGLNSRDILANEYSQNGYDYEASLRLNSHNQFLETQLAFGIPGTLILLWMLLKPLIRRKNTWNQSLIIPFLIIVGISMLFESILVRQWGIMFFVLFYCILLIPEKSTQVTSDNEAYKTST